MRIHSLQRNRSTDSPASTHALAQGIEQFNNSFILFIALRARTDNGLILGKQCSCLLDRAGTTRQEQNREKTTQKNNVT
jgi:hypothetical protein